MPKRDIIKFENDEASRVGRSDWPLTTTRRRRAKGAKLNIFIHCNPAPDTKVLGLTEILDELAEARQLSPHSQVLAIADIQARYGLSDEQVSDLLVMGEEVTA